VPPGRSASAQRDAALRIVSLFPALLGTYGDGGNAIVLAQRCRWRGIPVELVTVDIGDVVPASGDLYLVGGGEDGAQVAAATALASGGGTSTLARAIDAGAQLLAVCAGLQLAGTAFFTSSGQEMPGLGLLDLATKRLPTRAVGELLADPQPDLGLPPLSGFENHGGHTVLGPGVRPLALVRRGVGNGPGRATEPAAEGAVSANVVATYLHGPVLARNPALADFLLARAMGCEVNDLAPLDVPEQDRLRRLLGADEEPRASDASSRPRRLLGSRRVR
jgi:CobQ-like glutamine amidotransferase family enzyme